MAVNHAPTAVQELRSFGQVLDEELTHILETRRDAGLTPAPPGNSISNPQKKLKEALADRDALPQPLSALCLSGGGIRSATFALGVLQQLARLGVLKKFDYLSTVSGGGFVGSWLSAWIHREGREAVFRQLADSANLPGQDCKPVRHLREYSNYLSPRLGLFKADTWTLIAIYIRNLFLNWTVMLPLLLGMVMIPRLCVTNVQLTIVSPSFQSLFHGCGLFLGAWAVGVMTFLTPSITPLEKRPSQFVVIVLCVLPMILSGIFVTTAWAWEWRTGLSESGKFTVIPTFWSFFRQLILMNLVGWTMGFLLSILNAMFRNGRNANPGELTDSGGSNWNTFKTKLSESRDSERRPGLEFVYAIVVTFLQAGVLYVAFSLLGSFSIITAPMTGMRYFVKWYVCGAMPLYLVAFFIALSAFTGLVSRTSTDEDREWWARISAWLLIPAVAWGAISTLILIGPHWVVEQSTWSSYFTSLGGFAGIVSLVMGWSARTSSQNAPDQRESRFGRWAEYSTDIAGFLFSVAILMFVGWFSQNGFRAALQSLANNSGCASIFNYHEVGRLSSFYFALAATILPFVFAGLVAWFAVDINKFSLHATYRNRLIRAYLGASNRNRTPNPFTGFDPNDNIEMHHLQRIQEPVDADLAGLPTRLRQLRLSKQRAAKDRLSQTAKPENETDHHPNEPARQLPLHVINIALNLVGGDRLAWQQRKAASFTVTPLHCGYYLSGAGFGNLDETDADPAASGFRGTWRRWRERVRPRTHAAAKEGAFRNSEFYARDPGLRAATGISQGTALTLSGAAVSPNMGQATSGIVTFLLTLFNLRLGGWLGNPARHKYDSQTPSDGLMWYLWEALGLTNEYKTYVYLSDGGHFENLGLYEMVRRRCRVIIVSDAGQDPDMHFEDLGNAIRKIRIDLGISIDFPDDIKIHDRRDEDCTPDDRMGSQIGKYCAIGVIRYSDAAQQSGQVSNGTVPDGTLIYVKAAYYGDEPTDIVSYAATHKAFPHEPTSDQFFNESQFESYRALGRHAIQTIGGDDPYAAGPQASSEVEEFVRRAQRHAAGDEAAHPIGGE